MTAPVLSRPVAVSGLHGGATVSVSATPSERTALAAAYDLLEVRDLSAAATLTEEAGGAISVTGRVTADISQSCVVTLDPVAQQIDEAFAARFVRPGSPELPAALPRHEEIVVDPAAPDPPEVLSGGSIDLGRIVEEAFVLSIDPYPRSPGAVLASEAADADRSDSPFAVLARLKAAKG